MSKLREDETYEVGEVTVEVDGAEVTKGPKAKGDFVCVSADGSRFTTTTGSGGHTVRNRIHDKRRTAWVYLQVDSPDAARFAVLRESGKIVGLTVRSPDGDALFEGGGWIDGRDGSGSERRWIFIVTGQPH